MSWRSGTSWRVGPEMTRPKGGSPPLPTARVPMGRPSFPMEGGEGGGAPLPLESRIRYPDLLEGVRRILTRWRDREGVGMDSLGRTEQLTEELIQVSEAVADAATGRVVARPGDGLVLRRRLLEILREEIVSVWAEEAELRPHAEEMVGALEAFRQVADAWAPRWDDHFGVDLKGPDGLELAVEVAHDFRSPLSSILFLADTLREGGSGELNDLQKRQLSLIYGAALTMVSMASDVVDMGRGGVKTGEREPTPFPVSEIMESVREMVEPMAAAKGLNLVVTPPEGDLRLGDVEGLRRVLLNLTTNAVKFTSEGFVEISALARGVRTVEFSVRDTGPGIPDQAQSDLYRTFRPFQGRSGYHFSGTGLGLTIVRKLVRAMGGELEYETGRKLGTRFYFTLELEPATLV
ncbi:MAG: sensor histidine kinase [Gemmatimonadales bacterium]|nr:MAG: sensor histidine kinase [Gemmatimonadales bacterium]